MNQTTRAAATMFDFFPRKKEESITACIDFLSFPNNCYTYYAQASSEAKKEIKASYDVIKQFLSKKY